MGNDQFDSKRWRRILRTERIYSTSVVSSSCFEWNRSLYTCELWHPFSRGAGVHSALKLDGKHLSLNEFHVSRCSLVAHKRWPLHWFPRALSAVTTLCHPKRRFWHQSQSCRDARDCDPATEKASGYVSVPTSEASDVWTDAATLARQIRWIYVGNKILLRLKKQPKHPGILYCFLWDPPFLRFNDGLARKWYRVTDFAHDSPLSLWEDNVFMNLLNFCLLELSSHFPPNPQIKSGLLKKKNPEELAKLWIFLFDFLTWRLHCFWQTNMIPSLPDIKKTIGERN